MRRKEKEITEQQQIIDIIASSKVCRLALTDGDTPYIVPLCFGYKDNSLFFHSAPKGEKIDILNKNPAVCFEFDKYCGVAQADSPCAWGIKYQSVIGYGKAVFLEKIEEKREALIHIMKQYSNEEGPHQFRDEVIRKTTVFKVEIRKMTGKESCE